MAPYAYPTAPAYRGNPRRLCRISPRFRGGMDIFLLFHIMHRHPSYIRIPRRTLSVSHVLIIHIILGKIKLIFEF